MFLLKDTTVFTYDNLVSDIDFSATMAEKAIFIQQKLFYNRNRKIAGEFKIKVMAETTSLS